MSSSQTGKVSQEAREPIGATEALAGRVVDAMKAKYGEIAAAVLPKAKENLIKIVMTVAGEALVLGGEVFKSPKTALLVCGSIALAIGTGVSTDLPGVEAGVTAFGLGVLGGTIAFDKVQGFDGSIKVGQTIIDTGYEIIAQQGLIPELNVKEEGQK